MQRQISQALKQTKKVEGIAEGIVESTFPGGDLSHHRTFVPS